MGLVNVLKRIMTGIEIAGMVADSPEMQILEVAFPSPWLTAGLSAVRLVNDIADDYQANGGRVMADEAKRAEFAREFRATIPEATDGDLATLAGLLSKLVKNQDPDLE